jgi:alkaline phosphatase D
MLEKEVHRMDVLFPSNFKMLFQKDSLLKAARHEGGVNRRLFLAYATALYGIPMLGQAANINRRMKFASNPFSLGVASGDANSTSVVLWTRLAPKPLDPDGGMPNLGVPVQWRLATDDGMQNIAASGQQLATPQLGHSIHVTAGQLKPDTWYWFQFSVNGEESVVGRTRTMPARFANPKQLSFAAASCQSLEQGYYTAYDRMAEDELDLVFHLGDYIYEYTAGNQGNIRKHHGGEIESLSDYRVRHAQYKMDHALQKAHARCPWFVTWDDHEVDNNCADEISEQKNVKPVDFLIRRAAAYQAYYENMPLRRTSLPAGPYLQLYRRGAFGQLAEFMVLDGRQYRSDQPNNDVRSPLNEAALNPETTMLGKDQHNWLKQSLIQSRGTWNILAQQVMMGMVGTPSGDVPMAYSMDQWPGYTYERMDIVRFMADRKISNPVVLTGDIHSNWANELRIDDRKMDTPAVAAEFVGTSISSGGDGQDRTASHDKLLSDNPFIKFHNRQRGYFRCAVTQKTWTTDYMVADKVTTPDGKMTKRTSLVLENGSPSIQQA